MLVISGLTYFPTLFLLNIAVVLPFNANWVDGIVIAAADDILDRCTQAY